MQTQDLEVGIKITLTPDEMSKALEGEINGARFESWLWVDDSDYLHYFNQFDDSSFLITIDNTTEAREWLNSKVQHFLTHAED